MFLSAFLPKCVGHNLGQDSTGGYGIFLYLIKPWISALVSRLLCLFHFISWFSSWLLSSFSLPFVFYFFGSTLPLFVPSPFFFHSLVLLLLIFFPSSFFPLSFLGHPLPLSFLSPPSPFHLSVLHSPFPFLPRPFPFISLPSTSPLSSFSALPISFHGSSPLPSFIFYCTLFLIFLLFLLKFPLDGSLFRTFYVLHYPSFTGVREGA